MIYFSSAQKVALLSAWILLIIILLLSPMPVSEFEEKTTYVDKIIHAILFGVMAFLVFFSLDRTDTKLILNPNKSDESIVPHKKSTYIKFNKLLGMFLIAFSTSVGLSIVLEYAQVYVPGRTSNDYDLLAGVIGVVLVLLFIYGSNYAKKER